MWWKLFFIIIIFFKLFTQARRRKKKHSTNFTELARYSLSVCVVSNLRGEVERIRGLEGERALAFVDEFFFSLCSILIERAVLLKQNSKKKKFFFLCCFVSYFIWPHKANIKIKRWKSFLQNTSWTKGKRLMEA